MKRLLLCCWLGAAGCAAESATVEDPTFAIAGIVEGFYGTPWSHQNRLDILAFMRDVGLTDYVYAPKDDPYHLQRWREQYPPARLAQMRELVDSAVSHGIRFHYAISPGGSMTYSDTADYRLLLEKLSTIGELGVRHFGLFVDDVPPELNREPDRQRYEDLAAAHADLANRLLEDLQERGASLTVTPTTYTEAWGDQHYVTRLGELTDTAVPFLWTGSDVVAPSMTLREAREWRAAQGRSPLIWDNYPVNDFAPWRPFLGPLRDRDARLAEAVVGLLSNPMNQAHASMLPLATVAAYAEDPLRYDPDTALVQAIRSLYGDDAVASVLDLVGVWGSYAHEPNVFDPLFLPGFAIDSAAVEEALGRISRALAALRQISEDSPPLRGFVADLAPLEERTRARWTQLLADERFAVRNGRYEYRSTLDVHNVPPLPAAPNVNGRLDDALDLRWRALTHPSATGAVRAAAGYREGSLYLFLDVAVPVQDVRTGDRIGGGDHIAVVLQHDDSQIRRTIDPDDYLLLFPAPRGGIESTVLVSRQRYDGMVAKYLADNRGMTFGEFHVATFGERVETLPGVEYAARDVVGGGYVAEIRLPLRPEGRQRLSLTVTTSEGGARPTYGLATRNYPTNPATFATLVWRPGVNER